MDKIIDYASPILVFLSSFLLIFIFKNKNKIKKLSDIFISSIIASGEKQEMLNKAQINLTQILFRCKYEEIEQRGHCSTYDKERIKAVYTDYKKIGGNGFIDNMYYKIMAMPNEISKTKKHTRSANP